MEKVIDCMGMGCPLPVVNAKKAVEEFTEDGRLTVQVDNETAVKNLTKFAASRNFEVSSMKKGENAYDVTMLVRKATCEEAEKEKAGGRQGGVTVVLSANTMGTGEEKLGVDEGLHFCAHESGRVAGIYCLLQHRCLLNNGGIGFPCRSQESGSGWREDHDLWYLSGLLPDQG